MASIKEATKKKNSPSAYLLKKAKQSSVKASLNLRKQDPNMATTATRGRGRPPKFSKMERRKARALARKIQKVDRSDKSSQKKIDLKIVKEELASEAITNESSEMEPAPMQGEDVMRNEDNSSEITLSADESRETLSADESRDQVKTNSPKKKARVTHKRCGKPLKLFPKIKDNVMQSHFSALQRLHILLFGSSDKAENLKGNVLAFGGFPFLKGSDEWKQKEFLLSLLAQNTLKEYLDLLCIEHGEEDQQTLIDKLMTFLAAPGGSLSENELRELRATIPSPPPVRKKSIKDSPPIGKKSTKDEVKKKATKKNEKKKPKKPGGVRHRKVLMDEETVRRMERDLAREQRIAERERKIEEEERAKLAMKHFTKSLPLSKKAQSKIFNEPMQAIQKAPVTNVSSTSSDTELLHALLQTVYKRRALKEAGAVISVPKKDRHTRLGELANVKFLVITGNYNDLDVLHHLIYMTETVKSRVRKNILDFAGFNFAEDTPPYKDRMDFLNSLGFEISKRLAFLLGLCPFQTEIPQQDLNELIMYFLMSPCQTNQTSIKHLPSTFFSKDMPQELCQLLQKHSADAIALQEKNKAANAEAASAEISAACDRLVNSMETPRVGTAINKDSITKNPLKQKAKKSFKSSLLSKNQKLLFPSIQTLVLKPPSLPTANSNATKTLSSVVRPTQGQSLTPVSAFVRAKPVPVRLQAPTTVLSPQVFQTNPSSSTKQFVINCAPSEAQELFLRETTPEGKQKIIKVYKVASQPQAVRPQIQTATPSIVVRPPSMPSISTAAPSGLVSVADLSKLPPGLIIIQNNQTGVPIAINHPGGTVNLPKLLPKPGNAQVANVVTIATQNKAPGVLSNPAKSVLKEKTAEVKKQPTDEELYNSIQEIIHSANYEDITLRNVIDQVCSKYKAWDLSQRHSYMKECVKKIIMGTV